MTSENCSVRDIEKKIQGLIKRKTGDGINVQQLTFQPVSKIHFESETKRYVYMFSAIAFLILIVACINSMNLASAHSFRRTKEVGIRKVAGAHKTQLVKQFIGESIILTLVSIPLCLVFIKLFLPILNNLVDVNLEFNILTNYQIILGFISVAFITGLISGSYPALFVSSFQPASVLKTENVRISRKSPFRNILVVCQFVISIILILGTLVISNQMNFIKKKNLGFNQEHVLTIFINSSERSRNELLKTKLLKYPEILSVTGAGFSPFSRSFQSVRWEGLQEDRDVQMYWFGADYDFVNFFKMELIAGRDFSKDFPSDENKAYILNESAVKMIGWDSSSAIGRQFQVIMANNSPGRVIGVVKDFHFRSLHHEMQPLAIYYRPASCFYIAARLAPGNIQNTIKIIKEEWNNLFPDRPCVYSFFDEYYNILYRFEKRNMQMLRYFSVLSIIIACLGLFGLASFISVQRTKEIGIRKVLGATTPNVVNLLLKDFMVLLGIATLIAWPIGYFTMNSWLNNFAYRISIGAWIFLISAASVILIALFTVSYHAIKAAVCNPVDSLRYE